MLKKGKVSRQRKKFLVDEVSLSSWKIELKYPDSTDSKITSYFPCESNYYDAKKMFQSDVSITNGKDITFAACGATKKKTKKKALTSCNAQNTKSAPSPNCSVMRGRNSLKNTGILQEKKVKKEVRSKQLTDYFPVRRSVRKTLVTLKKEKQLEIEERILSGREDGYEVQDFIGKGRGVVSICPVKRGDFVLEYSGELISVEEAKCRECLYSHDENIGCYMYYFTHKNRQHCVDATRETGRLGRLVNHSKNFSNLKTKSILVQDKPRLILVADRDISAGEELLYDYGDRSKRSLESHPWLAS